MEKKYSTLQRIEHERIITHDTDYIFLYHLQSSLLLALRECGTLNAIQYRYAEEKLRQQRQVRVKHHPKRGGIND